MSIPCPWIFVLKIFLRPFLTIYKLAVGIINIYNLGSWPVLKEGLEHVLFDKYFLCTCRVNIVQFKNLDVENVKVDISNGAAGNGENISGIPHSYSCETKCTYHSVSIIKMLMLRTFMCIFRSIYDFMMKRCSFIYRYNGYTLDHIYDIWLWYGWGMRRRWNFIFWFYLGPWVFHLFLSMILEILSSSLLSLFSSYRYLPPSPPPPPILLILLLSQALVQKQGAVCSIIIKNRMVMEWGRHPTAVWGSDRS